MIANKIIEVRAYIGELNNEQSVLKNKLKEYEFKNEEIESHIGQKEGSIEEL